MSLTFTSGRQVAVAQWTSADIRIMLLSAYGGSARDPALDTVAQLLATAGVVEVPAAGGYSRLAVPGRTVSASDVTGQVAFAHGIISWPTASFAQPVAAAYYIHGANDAARQLIAFVDQGLTAATPFGSTYTVACGPLGVLTLG